MVTSPIHYEHRKTVRLRRLLLAITVLAVTLVLSLALVLSNGRRSAGRQSNVHSPQVLPAAGTVNSGPDNPVRQPSHVSGQYACRIARPC
jgi:hypothetical protein